MKITKLKLAKETLVSLSDDLLLGRMAVGTGDDAVDTGDTGDIGEMAAPRPPTTTKNTCPTYVCGTYSAYPWVSYCYSQKGANC